MPRRFIKRYLPDEAWIKEHPHLRRLGTWIQDPNLWHLNRNSVSLACMVGLFCALQPIPLQMLLAALLAVVVRSNLPISVGLVWITNPLTMPPVFYTTYRVGMFLLGHPIPDVTFEPNMNWLASEISRIWWPLLLGSLVSGILAGGLSYVLVRWLWIWRVGRSWRQRRESRARERAEKKNRDQGRG